MPTSPSRSHPFRRRTGLVMAAGAALVAPSILLTAPSAHAATQTFSYTGAEQTFEVPAGVSSIEVVAIGGRGGTSGANAAGGRAAQVTGTIDVTAGETLYVYVGGNATSSSPGFNGGGQSGGGGAGGHGGGASDVRSGDNTLGSRVLVAGGGGGGGAFDAPGGNAGAGGGDSDALNCNGGEAGTSTAGGASGGGDGGATAGSLGQGGTGGNTQFGRLGGGGGSGLYGGGGGGSIFIGGGGCGAGGGGGSSLAPSGGNVALAAAGSTPSITFTFEIVETTPPVVSDLDAAPDPAPQGVDATLTALAEDASGITEAEYAIDGGTWTAMSAADGTFGGTSESVTADVDTSSLSEGSHEFCVRARDGSGNLSATPPCSTFTVGPPDTTAPAVSALSATPDPVATGVDVTLSADADDAGGVTSAEYSIDGGAWTAMDAADGDFGGTSEGVTADVDTTSLSEGSHEFCVRATDGSGNVTSTPPCSTFTVDPPDTTAPTVDDLDATPDPVSIGELVTLTASADDIGNSGVASVQFALDGGAWTDMEAVDGAFDETAENVTADVDTSSLSLGSHEFCVRATDGSGNVTSTPPCSTFVVSPPDTTPPDVSEVAVSPDTATVGDQVSLTASATDDSVIVSAFYLLDGAPASNMLAADGAFDETSEDVELASISTLFFAPGARTLCVVVTDVAGNQSDGTDCVTLTLSADDGGGPGGDDDDDGSSDDDDDGSTGDDDDDDGSSVLPNTGATDASVTAGLGGLVAIAVGGMLLVKARMRPRHRA